MDTTDIFNSKDYRRSRNGYNAFCAFEYMISLLVTDAFLAKLLLNLGISDSLIGIISSIVSLACVFQFFSIIICRRRLNTKKTIITFYMLWEFIFMALYLIPFLPIKNGIKIIIMILIILGYFIKNVFSNILFRWANAYVSPNERAVFSAKKEIISLISGTIFTIAVGFIFDKFEKTGNIDGGFIFIAILILILTSLCFITLYMIKNEDISEKKIIKKSVSDILKNTLCNKKLIPVIFYTVLWYMTTYFTTGFIGTFKTSDLLISLFLIQVINMIANAVRIFVSVPFGRFSDKTSFANGIELSLVIAAVSFIFLFFTTKTTWYFIIIYTVLFAITQAGINQNSFNIVYCYVNKEYITEALSVVHGIGGLCGFGASIIASFILSYIQENGNRLFGINVYGQQILALISFVLCIAATLLVRLAIIKRDPKQRHEI